MEDNLDIRKINESVFDALKKLMPLMFISWCLIIFGIGIILVFVFSVIIGIQFIRKQRVSYGVCLMIFGGLTLGIWPFIAAYKETKREAYSFDIISNKYKKSLLNGYNIALILVIIGMVLLIFHNTIILSIGVFLIAIQDYRRDKLAHGTLISFLGIYTLGIWPLIYLVKQRKLLSEEILSNEIEAIEPTQAINFRKVKNIPEGVIIACVISAFVVIPFIIFGFLFSNVQSVTAKYIDYAPIVVTVEDTIPSTKSGYSFYFDTSTKVQIVVCGEDIPVGEYMYIVNENSTIFQTLLEDKGLTEPAGFLVEHNQNLSVQKVSSYMQRAIVVALL